MTEHPETFAFGAEAPDGSAWLLFGEQHKRNPRLELEPSDLHMVSLWNLYRDGHLPEAGGVLDQAAINLEAFSVMNEAMIELAREAAEEPGH